VLDIHPILDDSDWPDGLAAGNWSQLWDGKDNHGSGISSGIYFIRMQAGKESFVRKAIMMK